MTSCTASFQETNVNVGDTINADFTWTDAVLRGLPYLHYAYMSIKDPDGNVCGETYFELEESSGSKELTCVTDMAGIWTCQIEVWQGAVYVPCTDTVTVSAPTTSCTVSFQETSAKVGDTIHADFTWSNGKKNPDTFSYAIMFIRDPNGDNCDSYAAWTDPSGSKTLSCVTDMAGTWKALISVWNGFMWIECTATITVSEGDFTLYEALTCLWVNGYADHGLLVTNFDIGEKVYAYSEIHGPDMYGKVVKHEWWYKKAGESEFTKKWEYIWDPIDGHYTGYANWTYWDIGSSYGPGEGYIKVYLDNVLLGTTNNYSIVGKNTIGAIDFAKSTFNEGPFEPGTYQLIATVWCENVGTETGKIYIKRFIDGEEVDSYSFTKEPGASWSCCNFYWDIPENAFTAGVKVWGEGEDEPEWGTTGTKIFKILRS